MFVKAIKGPLAADQQYILKDDFMKALGLNSPVIISTTSSNKNIQKVNKLKVLIL